MLRAGQGLILVVITLLTLGVVMVTSAGLEVAEEAGPTLEAITGGRTALIALAAVAAMLIASRIPLRWLERSTGITAPGFWIIPLCIVLLLAVHLPGIGNEVNGARRWLKFGPVGFQPSEVAKWGLVIVFAWWGVRNRDQLRSFRTGFLPFVIVLGVVVILIASEDLGTATLVGMVGVCVLLAAGLRFSHALLLVPIGAAGFTAAVFASPYRIERLRAFLDPFDDPTDIGYHVIQSMHAVAGGGLAGRGLGNSVQKFGYLPEPTTDFIFAIICEEMGFAGAALVVGLFAVLLLTGLAIVRRSPSQFQRLLGLGILLTIGFQALINLAVVTGVAPTKGIALPLISSGGTGWILTAASIGLLLAIEQSTLAAVDADCSAASAGDPPSELDRPTSSLDIA